MQNKSRAFTLIELLVVVLIIGILAAVAVPQYQAAVEKTRVTNLFALLEPLAKAEEVYYLANGSYTNQISDLDVKVNYKQELGCFTTGGKCYQLSDGHWLGLFTDFEQISVGTDYVQIRRYFVNSSEGSQWWCGGIGDIGKKVCASLGVKNWSNGVCDFTGQDLLAHTCSCGFIE